MSGGAPQVARCEDYDSEVSTEKPGTKKEARRKSTSTTRPKTRVRYHFIPRDVASDSGYSSHISGTHTAKPALTVQTPASKPTVTERTARSKPVLHRSDSQRSKEKDAARSSSRPELRMPCADLVCQHDECHRVRSSQRRHSMSQPYAFSGQQQQQHQQPMMPPPPPQHSYPQYPPDMAQWARVLSSFTPPMQRPPTPMAGPHMYPRQVPVARSRPTSFHGHPYASVNGMQQPPPAASAYQNIQYANTVPFYQHQQPRQYQQDFQYTTAPPYAPRVAYHSPSPTMPSYPTHYQYPQPSPTTPSPTSATFGGHSAYPSGWPSAPTQPAPVVIMQPAPAPRRRYSGRQQTLRHPTIPGAYPRDESEDSEAFSDSSEYDYEEEARERKHRHRDAQEGKHMRSSRGRPSLRRQYASAPAAPTRERRDSHDSGTRRNHRPDPKDNYPPLTESDRTVRATSTRSRTLFTDSTLSSRRPSVSTNASSGKTKATTVSGGSGAVHVIVERNGRPSTYLSREKQQYLESTGRSRRAQDDRHQQLLEEAEAYQDARRGPQPEGLTALNIRDQPQQQHSRSQPSQHQRHRSTRSHTTTHSHTSSRTNGQAGEGTRIEITGSMLNLIPGGVITVGMRAGDDGQQTWVLGSGEEGSRAGRRNSGAGGSRRGEVRRSGGSHDAASLGTSFRESETLRGEEQDLGGRK